MKPPPIIKRLARLADDNGIAAVHLERHPDLVESIGLDPKDIDDAMLRQADEFHDYQMRESVKKYGLTYSC